MRRALVLIGLTCSCIDPYSEIIVTIDTELAIPCVADAIEVDVIGTTTQTRRFDLQAITLPGSLTLERGAGEEVTVSLRAFQGETLVAEASGTEPFEDGESRELYFVLDSTCVVGAPCGPRRRGDFGGLPAAVARRSCVSSYAARDTFVSPFDACGAGQIDGEILLSVDEAEAESPLDPKIPFDFYFFNQQMPSFWLGSNGYLIFSEERPEALTADIGPPRSLAEDGFPGPGVAAFWDSLQTSSRGVCVSVQGEAPNRILWSTWHRACFEGATPEQCGDDLTSGELTFSVGLEETTNKIILTYSSMRGVGAALDRAEGLTATVGVANSEDEGRACSAAECGDDGLCDSSAVPCGFTEIERPSVAVELVPQ